ncbi:MAG: hypothetical protein ACOC9Y_09940 [Chloroflexota bacterium]
MVQLDGRTVCSVEHADQLIGGQQVVEAREDDGYLYLRFANGASVPLTCPCCGGRLHLRSMSQQQLSSMLTGRTLEGFRHGEWVGEGADSARHPIFALQFSGDEDRSARTMQVHLDSVRAIRAGG